MAKTKTGNRTSVKNLPAKVKELSKTEGKKVRGGAFKKGSGKTITINGTA
jgi:hypothetical protein